jgi:cytochrome c oxidase subunit IV
MGDHTLSYAEEKKTVFKGLILLAVVTLIEVFTCLLGKGFVIEGFYLPSFLIGIVVVVLSIYKAYFIIFEFMHLGHEVKGLAWSILLPLILLVWFIIAMLYEGTSWKDNRKINTPVDLQPVEPLETIEGNLLQWEDTYLY